MCSISDTEELELLGFTAFYQLASQVRVGHSDVDAPLAVLWLAELFKRYDVTFVDDRPRFVRVIVDKHDIRLLVS